MSPTRKELAFRYLQDKLASGVLSPGDRLSDLALAREMGISRTPVREAINQLASEGMVEMRPHEGAFVRRLSRQDIRELYELRQVLESYAAGRMAENRESLSDVVAELQVHHTRLKGMVRDLNGSGRKDCSAEEMGAQHEIDIAFHRAIVHAAGNRRVEQVIAESRIYDQLFGSVSVVLSLKTLRLTYKHHSRILTAIEKGDADKARVAMTEHIQLGLSARLAAMKEEISPECDVPEVLRKFL